MKTEQEQIEQIMCMFNKLRRGDYCVNNCYGCCGDEKIDITCHDVVVNFIQALMQAGYGDVSEYKAEIERFRTTLGQCNTELNGALESLKSQCREIGELKAKIKQAQIDVLKKLRSRISDRDSLIQSYIADGCFTIDDMYTEIDELIKEVQNAEDKG